MRYQKKHPEPNASASAGHLLGPNAKTCATARVLENAALARPARLEGPNTQTYQLGAQCKDVPHVCFNGCFLFCVVRLSEAPEPP
eukprot:9500870-Pyramimonas_sp.AAC.1